MEAYFAGYDSYARAAKWYDNPYPENTADHDLWMDGWLDHRDEIRVLVGA
jgi:hypothetical protein